MSFIAEPIRISPHYTVNHWRSISFTTEEEWQKAIDIFEDRIYGRFLKVVEFIEHYEYAGFAVLALDCLLIETMQQFLEGESETPPRKSGEYFVRFLTETSFGKFFDKHMADMFYEQIRCGILHQAEIKSSSRVRINKNFKKLARLSDDGKGLIINRKLFHKQLITEFKSYVTKLRKNNPPDKKLRGNFRRKMDYICQVPLVEYR